MPGPPMPARTFTALLALILAGTVSLHAQDQPPSADAAGPISTDRPAITNSSVVVPSGSLQVENGFLETGSQGQSVIDAPETLVRFGLAKTTELRFTVPDYFHNLTTGNGVGSGFGDVAIGVKQQLGPARGFDVSVIAFLSCPTGAPCLAAGTTRDCRCRGRACCPPTGRQPECSRYIGPLRAARET